MLHHLFSIHGIISLLTLTLLEVILGIDNIVMIVVFASKLPKSEQNRARRIGLLAALVSRIFLLFCISWLLGINTPLFEFLDKSFSIKDIILIQ